MRTFLKSRVNWSGVGWFWFWGVALLVLPNCTLDRSGIVVPSNVDRGTGPRTSTIFCDIERPEGRHCASPAEIDAAIRLTGGAVALVAGQTSSMGLDESPEARARCGGGPEVVTFQGPFPEGSPVCLDCAVIPASHPNSTAVCVALCQDLFSTTDGNVPPSAEAVAFCASRARLSTNFPSTGCFLDACSTAGIIAPGFADPRRIPEPVTWQNLIGVSAVGGSLTRTAATSGMWDAAAASTQVIASGDGYVEFIATETNRARMVGLSSGAPPDTDANFTDITFGIDVFSNGEISIFESGSLVSTFGPYTPNERFRVKVRDNLDGMATVSYVRVAEPCVDGSPCAETLIHTSATAGAYPFRVDSSLFDLGATVTGARLVRIQ